VAANHAVQGLGGTRAEAVREGRATERGARARLGLGVVRALARRDGRADRVPDLLRRPEQPGCLAGPGRLGGERRRGQVVQNTGQPPAVA
jgi:hypothetical protein